MAKKTRLGWVDLIGSARIAYNLISNNDNSASKIIPSSISVLEKSLSAAKNNVSETIRDDCEQWYDQLCGYAINICNDVTCLGVFACDGVKNRFRRDQRGVCGEFRS